MVWPLAHSVPHLLCPSWRLGNRTSWTPTDKFPYLPAQEEWCERWLLGGKHACSTACPFFQLRCLVFVVSAVPLMQSLICRNNWRTHASFNNEAESRAVFEDVPNNRHLTHSNLFRGMMPHVHDKYDICSAESCIKETSWSVKASSRPIKKSDCKILYDLEDFLYKPLGSA